MGRIIRAIIYIVLGVFILCQIPMVQHQIVRRVLPADMQIIEIKSYGLFPIYTYIPTLIIKKGSHDFVQLKNGVLDARYFLLRKQVAFDAQQLIVHKVPSDKKVSIRELLDQLPLFTIFHDFNIGSLQYQDGDQIHFDYKIDWDLKRDRIKLYAKQNEGKVPSSYPERVEIEGVPYPDEIRDGQIKIVKDTLCLTGSFHLKNWVLKTDLSLNQGESEIAKIQPTVDLTGVDKICVPELKILSPFFQWSGLGEMEMNPVSAVLKNNRFFLGLEKTIQDGLSN